NIYGTNYRMDYYENNSIWNTEESEKEPNDDFDFHSPSEKFYREFNQYDIDQADISIAQIDSEWIELGGITRVPIQDDVYVLLFLIPVYLLIFRIWKRKFKV
ncbi:MAG: hypothetical protein LIO93_06915, partial [Bacteroidales bacterium]|nr:hypothetical protein [Bacteroidales bacterium]